MKLVRLAVLGQREERGGTGEGSGSGRDRLFALPALIVFLPVALICHRLAMNEKAKALAASNVKVKALDVVASYKVLVAIILFPIYNLFLSLLLCPLLVPLLPPPLSPLQQALLWSSVYWVGLPLVEYLFVFVCDRFMIDLRELLQRLQIYQGGMKAFLLSWREALKKSVRTNAEIYGPKLFGGEEEWEKQRIISRADLGLEEAEILIEAQKKQAEKQKKSEDKAKEGSKPGSKPSTPTPLQDFFKKFDFQVLFPKSHPPSQTESEEAFAPEDLVEVLKNIFSNVREAEKNNSEEVVKSL